MGIPADVLDWFLQPDNPPVRYLTLKNLLRKPPESAEVRKARARLMDYSVTREILLSHCPGVDAYAQFAVASPG